MFYNLIKRAASGTRFRPTAPAPKAAQKSPQAALPPVPSPIPVLILVVFPEAAPALSPADDNR